MKDVAARGTGRPPALAPMPVEPPPSAWAFPPADEADETGVVALGGDLEPGTLLSAYRHGLFPMPVGRHGELGWWSPEPRGVIPLDGLRVSRSLRRSVRRFEIRVDTVFHDVVRACADPTRPDGWITPQIHAAYTRLHRLGWAHSVEAWDPEEGLLVGGLYGVAISGAFFGESMFSRERDASKVALAHLVLRLKLGGYRLLDTQFVTDHLRQFGATEILRADYHRQLAAALATPARFYGAVPPSVVASFTQSITQTS